MKKKSFFVVCTAMVFMLFFMVVFLGAQNQPMNKVADMNVGAYGIQWQPRVSYAKITLSVACPGGQVFYKDFAGGAAPYFSLSDLKGQINDGSYTYELRVSPFTGNKNRKAETETKIGSPIYQAPLTQSGYFLVSGGAIWSSNASEVGPAKPQDILHYDDVIITGSLCVGYDCVDGETFNYDTIRLKENNLQIHFDDTSTSAGFPANDWRIIINDSSSGGGNYFSVEDSTAARKVFVVEAGARANALYVDDAGRVGLGTSTPIYQLHLQYGDSPCVRLHQDTSYGWTEQKWDISGNEANFFIRDGTNGSKLPFRIQPAAPTNSIYIKNDGSIGMGTSSPGFPLEIERTSEDVTFIADRTDGATAQMSARSDKTMFGSRTDHQLNLCTNNSPRVTISTAGYMGIADTTPSYPIEVGNANGAYLNTSGNWVNPSSRTLKENIASLSPEEAIDTLNNLNPVKYNFKVDKDEQCVGFISEDVPELVAVKNKKGIVTMDVVGVLTKVVQEQQKTIADLNKRISELEKK